jgi:hypothetical protein
MTSEHKRTYLITGSSSGVGAACALQLASFRYKADEGPLQTMSVIGNADIAGIAVGVIDGFG